MQQEAGSTNGGEAEGEHGDEHNEFEDVEEEGEHEEAVEDEGGAVRKRCSHLKTQQMYCCDLKPGHFKILYVSY